MKDRFCGKCKSLCEWLVIEKSAKGTFVEAMCPACLKQPTEYWEGDSEIAEIHNARTLWLELRAKEKAES